MFSENRLKELRKENNLSQTELAKILGVSKSTISMYEIGKRLPPTDVLNKMADFFGVTTDYLLGRTNQKYFSSEETIAFSTTEKLTEEDQKMIRGIIDNILERMKEDKKKDD